MRRSHVGYPDFSMSFRGASQDDSVAEAVHQDALEAAHIEHERVRQIAEEALELAELRFDQLRLQETVQQETERLQLERERAALAAKAIELQRQHISIPKPPPRAPSPPPPSPPAPPKAEPPKVPVPVQEPPKKLTAAPPSAPKEPVIIRTPSAPSKPADAPPPTQPKPQLLPQPAPPKDDSPPQRVPAPPVKPSQVSAAHFLPGIERYGEIHKNLKHLRKFMDEEKKRNPVIKNKMGDMRRAIRVAIGQLTDVKGANRGPNAKIKAILQESLTLESTLVDPSMVVVSTPPPTQDSPEKLPCLFIYLLNILSKVVVKQFIEEAGANPKAAEPIGVVAVSVFAQADFQWRNQPLIDILMAKMRIVCPVVFGIRSSDRTQEGRSRNGWWQENGEWVAEQTHNTRMTGLGAGYASIALRDFSKTRMKNPWPPALYWQSLASMVSTPEPSSTQYLVVKAMIDGYEQRFLSFYGSAGRAALQAALVDFPRRDTQKTVAASSLATLGDKLKKDVGLKLGIVAG